MIDEFKGVIAQNCDEYESSNNLIGITSMSIYGANCANCNNFKNSKCTKNMFDSIAKIISNN